MPKQQSKCNIYDQLKDEKKRNQLINSDKNAPIVAKHLRENNHGSLFPFGKCKHDIGCHTFKKVLIGLRDKSNVNLNDKDEINSHAIICTSMASNNPTVAQTQ